MKFQAEELAIKTEAKQAEIRRQQEDKIVANMKAAGQLAESTFDPVEIDGEGNDMTHLPDINIGTLHNSPLLSSNAHV